MPDSIVILHVDDDPEFGELVLNFLERQDDRFEVLAIIRAVAGEIGFWIELVIIAIVVFAYRPIVMRLGLGPSSWEEE